MVIDLKSAQAVAVNMTTGFSHSDLYSSDMGKQHSYFRHALSLAPRFYSIPEGILDYIF